VTDALAPALASRLASGVPVAEVVVVAARGSTPREAGARMLITADAIHGTIGGGRLEWAAIERARRLLGSGESEAVLDMPLGPEVGQCCGGHVRLSIRRADHATLAALEAAERAEAAGRPTVLLFGAGHVGQELARALAPLPVRVRWLDPRPGQFPPAVPHGVLAVTTDRLVDEVRAAPAGAACLVLTHSHALDFEICLAALQRDDLTYLGLIGSATKRARFERGFRALGLPRDRIKGLVCPIGGGEVRDKRPAVIAALAAAELITVFARRAVATAGATPLAVTG
jgi:xanthine dehydrogenase accessory protein XdhC